MALPFMNSLHCPLLETRNMEVDLTDDDVIFTSPSTVPKRQNAPKPTKQTKPKQPPPAETIEISDDDEDDLVGEAHKRPVGEDSAMTKANEKVLNKEAMVISDDDDDDVIEVVESSPQTQNQKAVDKSREKPSSSKTLQNDDVMEVDDVIEVVEPINAGPVFAKPPTSASVTSSSTQATGVAAPSSANLCCSRGTSSSGFPSILTEASVNQGLKSFSSLDPSVKIVPPTYLTPRSTLRDDEASKSKESSSKAGDTCGNDGKKENSQGGDVIEIFKLPSALPNEKLSSGNEPQTPNTTSAMKALKVPQKEAKNTNRASDKRYVVDITDDKGSKKRPESNCLNVLCKSGIDMQMAPMFVVSYYNCKLKKGVYEVCAACFDEAINHCKVCNF